MINTQAIRNKILNLAMRGKLTEQLPEDGTSEELYQQIIVHKNKLFARSTIKKDKSIPIQESEKEKPSIPSNWKWVVFGKVITLISGQDLKTEEYNASESGIPYLTGASNFDEKSQLIINRWTEQPKNIAVKGDILLSCKGTVGKLAILEVDRVHIARQFMSIRTYDTDVRFTAFFIQSIIDGIKKVSKGLIPGIERDDILRLSLPLPPLAEQQRIVEKIEQAFSALDTIDTLQAKYADNLTVMKGKLIDAAIQGKLTEQLPEDGMAEELYQQIQAEKQALIKTGKIKKEKPLPEISAEEIPFEIPSNWCWCRLISVFNFIDYRGATPNKISEGVPFVTAKNVRQGYIDYSISEYISEEDYQKRQSRGISHKGDLLFTTEAPMGYAAIADLDRFSAGQRLITLQQYTDDHLLENKYYMYAISTPFFQKQLDDKCSGTTVKGIKADRLKQFLIPLPPLAEQKRIVESLDKFLAVCDEF